MTTWTWARAWTSRRARTAALYAAMPPVTPSSTRRSLSGLTGRSVVAATSWARGIGLLDPDPLGALVGDLALRDLLEGDGQRLALESARLEERRDVLPATLA